jgi:thymidylate kinase
MIVELLGLRASGKSTLHRLIKEELSKRGHTVVHCRHWDNEIRRDILSRTAPQVDVRKESGFQNYVHRSELYGQFEDSYPDLITRYAILCQTISLYDVGLVPRLRTGRKYFARWLRATKSSKLCLWDKGLVQVAAKLFFHNQQYLTLKDVRESIDILFREWPCSDFYVYLDVSPETACSRAKRRKQEWDLETYKDVKPLMDYMVTKLHPVMWVDNNGKPEDVVEDIANEISSCYSRRS